MQVIGTVRWLSSRQRRPATGWHLDLGPYGVAHLLHRYGYLIRVHRTRETLRQRDQRRALPRERIEDGHSVTRAHQRRRSLPGNVLRLCDDLRIRRFGLLVDAVNRRARQNVVELVEQHDLPRGIQRRRREIEALESARGDAPHLRLAQGQLALAIALLRLGLRREHTPVRLEVQLTDVARIRPATRVLILEEIDGVRDGELGRTLQVFQTAGEFQVIARRATATVAKAEGIKPRGEAILLHALVPAPNHTIRIDARVVVIVQVDEDLGTIDALPDEGIVGEGIAAVVRPEDLLRGEILDAAAAHNLRHRARIAEDIGQPQQFAVHTKLVLEEAFAVDKLADQRLAAGDVGVRLDPRAAFGDVLPGLHGILDARVDVGITLLQHPEEVRLTLQELVLRILRHQRQLRRHCAPGLALGLLERPEPRHVDVRVAEGEHLRHGRAVDTVQQRLEARTSSVDGRQHRVVGHFEVHDQREVAQARIDLHQPHRVGIEVSAQLPERLHVQPQLINLLLPDAEGRVTDNGLRRAGLGDGLAVGRRRSGVAVAQAVPGVTLDQQIVARAGDALHRQRDLVVLAIARARSNTIHIDDALGLHIHRQHDALPSSSVGQRQRTREPAVLPLCAPRRARRHRQEVADQRLVGRQLLQRHKPVKRHTIQRSVKVARQLLTPMIDPIHPSQ